MLAEFLNAHYVWMWIRVSIFVQENDETGSRRILFLKSMTYILWFM